MSSVSSNHYYVTLYLYDYRERLLISDACMVNIKNIYITEMHAQVCVYARTQKYVLVLPGNYHLM